MSSFRISNPRKGTETCQWRGNMARIQSFRISNPRKGTETMVATRPSCGVVVSAYLIPARGLKR